MPNLAVTDVTVALASGNLFPKRDVNIEGRKRRARVKITFGDGVKTYPVGGVPMPDFTAFGMVRNLEMLHMYDAGAGNAFMFKYDSQNNTIRIYNPGAELQGALDAPPAQTIFAEAVGW